MSNSNHVLFVYLKLHIQHFIEKNNCCHYKNRFKTDSLRCYANKQRGCKWLCRKLPKQSCTGPPPQIPGSAYVIMVICCLKLVIYLLLFFLIISHWNITIKHQCFLGTTWNNHRRSFYQLRKLCCLTYYEVYKQIPVEITVAELKH